MGCACFPPRRLSKAPACDDERFQTTVSVLVHLSLSDEAAAAGDQASRKPAAPLAVRARRRRTRAALRAARGGSACFRARRRHVEPDWD